MSGGPALELEGVSKMYRLGQVGTGTLAHDLNRMWARLRGREDPAVRVGAVNDRTAEGTDDFVWALRDIDLRVEQGDILGIIGRNGAGKSTLLKLLSRVTAPTRGQIRIRGRMASLLEVGTGFHPELTGLENIYLNGAILGMRRREIRDRLDEIIDFSGCAKYIDTPVKRYSSGMYVRLAFAVGAHLEADILVVDEVLAVGDAEFQARCLGKMQDLGQRGGRTVLFVSHNLASVRQLCPRSVLMHHGTIKRLASTGEIIDEYMRADTSETASLDFAEDGANSNELALHRIEVRPSDGSGRSLFTSDDELEICVDYELLKQLKRLRLSLSLFGESGALILTSSDFREREAGASTAVAPYQSICRLPRGFLNVGRYRVELAFEVPFERVVLGPVSLTFAVDELGDCSLGPISASRPPGLLHPPLRWQVVAR